MLLSCRLLSALFILTAFRVPLRVLYVLQFNDLQAVTILRDHWNFPFWPTSNAIMKVDHDRWRLSRPSSSFSYFFCTKTLQHRSFHGGYPHGMALLCLTTYFSFTCHALVCHRKFPFLAMVYMGGVCSRREKNHQGDDQEDM